MSFISDKFNVPEETIKSMMRSGIISCSWEGREEVYKLWKQGKSIGDIAIELGRSKSTIHAIIKMFNN